MAVPEQTPYIEHTGNGVTTSFSLEFQCESKDHLIVLVDEVEPPIATWSLTGGNVVFTTAPAAGKKITLQRNTPFGRTTDYQSFNNSFRPPAVNKDFDWIWLKLQELGVADWILSTRINDLRAYVERQDSVLQENIDNLKTYVDDRDDELRAYLLEEIRKQGVALDQLDEYYNYLMQRLAQIAVSRGWDASFIADAGGSTQQDINDFGGAKWRNKAGGYALGATVKLDNGDTVKSTVDGNTNDPNVDMTGWVKTNDSSQISFKQPEATSVPQTAFLKESKTQHIDDYATPQNAVDAKRNLVTDIKIPAGTFNIIGSLGISSYHDIRGCGDGSVLKFSGAGNGIKYTSGYGRIDDHVHHTLKNFRVEGDGTGLTTGVARNGTTVGYSYTSTGHFGSTSDMMFNQHSTGLKIESAYTNSNQRNYYRANNIGLHLVNVTSHREDCLYARYNESAVVIEGTFQNITLAGGGIEGNNGRGIWLRNVTANSFPKLVLDDVYMESNGNEVTGLPSVEVEYNERLHIDVRAGSYWRNSRDGVFSGCYKWGYSVAFDAVTMNSSHYAKRMRIKDCIVYCKFNTAPSEALARLNTLTEPTMMLEFSPAYLADGIGVAFQVPFNARTTRKLLQPNEVTVTYPHIVTKSASVTLTENSDLDYGDGSWTNIAFPATGDYNNNYAQLTNLSDQTSEYIGKVFSFLLRPETDCEIGFLATGTKQTQQAYFKLKAGVTYKFCCPSVTVGAGDYRMRLFSIAGAANISYLPIHLSKFKTAQETINFANMLATGVI